MAQQVRCITKSGGDDFEHITHIGGVGWRYAVATAIAMIKIDAAAFYTESWNAKAYLRVASRNGKEYVRTTPDTTFSDNLLALPACS